jgi:serine/threonine-protein kinase
LTAEPAGGATPAAERPAATPVAERAARATPAAFAPTVPTPAGGALGEPAARAAAAADPGFDPLVGAVLAGRYQVVRRIGEGGMGAVYEAKHTLIGKRVAVKVLLEKFIAKSDFVARLLQEARLASSIGHENIVDVTDFGTTDDGRSFVVMEFLDGESLAELTMREAPLPIERSLRIARQAASALGAAHAKGIFHRDVKPENIYLVRRGDADFVKVVDFGISKAVKPGGAEEGAEAYRLTHTGLLLGTPLYMSPEQARGDEDLDHRVDIWALGVMLYECLTGEVPFRANNYLQIISQVLTHTPAPPSQLRPELGIPDAVETVVMRAMEKDRAKRYQTMAELEQDIDRLLAGDQNVGLLPAAAAAAAASTSAPGRWPYVTAAIVLLGGVGYAVSHWSTAASVAAPAPPVAAAPAPPSPPVAAPAGAAVPAAPLPAAAPATAPPGPERLAAAVRRLRVRAERPAKPPAKAAAKPETSDSKRGVLAPASQEGYQDK